MKLTIYLIAVIGLAIISCDNGQKSELQTSNNAENTTTQLYEFVETWDKHYCNEDSVVPTDCGGGNIYLTKNGNAIYTSFCYGSDTTYYSLGKYSINDSVITCDFSRNYFFYNGYSDDETEHPFDPNSGTIKESKPFSVILKKLHCPKFEYYFLDGEYKYVVLKSNTDNSNFFFQSFNKVKVFKDL